MPSSCDTSLAVIKLKGKYGFSCGQQLFYIIKYIKRCTFSIMYCGVPPRGPLLRNGYASNSGLLSDNCNSTIHYFRIVHLVSRSPHNFGCSIYGSTALVGLGRFFSFLIYTQSVGLLGRVISPSQGRYLHTEQKQNKRIQTSMPRVGFGLTIPVFDRVATVISLLRVLLT
jgi:hypothetical protein